MKHPPSEAVSPKQPVRILALCDTLAVPPGGALTGFGRVALNLFSEWERVLGDLLEIDVWAIGFEGHGYQQIALNHRYWQLLPGGNEDWYYPKKLELFLRQLSSGRYTHAFILMDASPFTAEFAAKLRQICAEKKPFPSCIIPWMRHLTRFRRRQTPR